MKLAIISDIHGNVPALEAVLANIKQWQADRVVVNGDVINRGPYSRNVLSMLQEFSGDNIYIKGNHEDFVIFANSNPLQKGEYNYDLRCFAQWTADQIGSEWLAKIQSWCENYDCTIGSANETVHITHGSRLGNRDGIHLNLSEEELKEKDVHHSDVFISSHTHLPMIRRVDGTLVMNSGSVGQPLDNDERASYGRLYLDANKATGEIVRIRYDKSQAIKDFHESGFLPQGGPVCRLILLELTHNRRFVGPFMHQYLREINSRQISVQQAVETYIQAIDI